MPRLTSGEINALMGAIRDIHACRDAADLARVAVEAMARVIPTDRADFQIYRNAPDSFETLHRHAPLPGDADREALYQDIMVEHPIVAHVLATGAKGPFILSDFISSRAWRQTRFWAECCREPGDNHLLCNAVTIEPGVQLSLSFSRRLTDFNEHHRMILRLAQDHIAQAWENARHFEWLEYGMEVEGRAIAVVGPENLIQVAGRRATTLLRRYFPDWRGSRLPVPLAEWLEIERRRTRAAPDLAVPTVFHRAQEEGSLTVRLLPASGHTAAPEVLSLEERNPAKDAARLQTLGLTPRQAQVLYWMMQGRSNPDIAALLAVRPRTVDKFAEAIFRRLGVENRLAASLRARDALNEMF
jgi:DNA-binding CsgD family transcriptional regulator/GAF domain-containing protein